MEALKSTSIHILIIGALICIGMYQFTDSTVTMVFATAFTAIVSGRKVRDVVQSSKGLYYDKEENELKKV